MTARKFGTCVFAMISVAAAVVFGITEQWLWLLGAAVALVVGVMI